MAFFLPNKNGLRKTQSLTMQHTGTLDKEWDLDLEQQILRAIKHVRYGSVEIVIHDSKVVQIERKEKLRLDNGNFRNRK
jgi:hypothetical protein